MRYSCSVSGSPVVVYSLVSTAGLVHQSNHSGDVGLPTPPPTMYTGECKVSVLVASSMMLVVVVRDTVYTAT